MNKEIFLRSLGELLKEKVPSKEINEILVDYNEYFEAGKAEGRTEEELVTEFGSPKTIVNELLNDNQPTAADTIRNTKLSSYEKRDLHIIAAMVFLISLLCCFRKNDLMMSYHGDILMALILPLFLALSGIHKLFLQKFKLPSKKQTCVCTIFSVIFMVLILAILTGFIYFLLNFRNMILTADTAVIVRTIDSLIYTLYFLVLITTILILILANKNFRAIVFLFFLSGEFLTGLDIVNKFESGSTDMSQYAMPIIVKVLYPFVFGIILTSIFLIFMSLKRRFIRDRK